MDGTITYLNTDLDLTSADDLTDLAAALKSVGLSVLHLKRRDDGFWDATFKSGAQHDQPEPDIEITLAIAESLGEPLRSVWARCTRREFNIGYECGIKPWAFTHGISSELLGRMAGRALGCG